ncbi:MAG: carbohydrate porin [Pseudolabrys sp.]
MALGAGVAQAADMAAKAPKAPPAPQSIWERETLTGDWGGLRTDLHNKGIDITAQYIAETFGVLSGGLERRGTYEGRFEFSLDADLQKLVGWTGASAHVTAFQIHNGGRNAANIAGSIADPSNIDALKTTRLFTAWFQQDFNGIASLRVGQLAADDEFFTSDTAGGLLNGTFGWGNNLAANMTNGGPAYPLATPGARLQVNASDNLTFRGGVFAGDPAGKDCNEDAQKCNRHGVTFSTSGGTLWMGEAQYAVNQGKNAIGLPGVYKIGAWYQTADFADRRYGLDAGGATVLLSDPAATDPLNHSGNWGIYGVADQTVWRGGERSVSLFLRGGYSPKDRNLITWYVDGGVGFKGIVPRRADDTFTLGISYAKISDDVVSADRDAGNAVRDYEVVLEASYAAQITPWWVVQPDLQYIVHPNGGQNPDDGTQSFDHAFLAGLRSTITF